MSRPRRAPSSPVQLFPFLAVLVSTIGALVLLLLAINRQSTLQAIARAVGLLAQQTSSEEEALALRGDELAGDVAALREQLLRLRDEQQGVDRKLFATDRKALADAAKVQSSREQLAAVRARRVDVERDLESVESQIAARAAAKNQLAADRTDASKTFVPIVHPGANGTDRQPIYIECTGETVTIWPENVSVPTAALESNDLAQAALARTVRELGQYYLDRERRTEPEVRKRLEPYPLLLVRPDGVQAYRAVCDALVRERGFSFGYELIEADWSLRFPDPDPRAREVALTAIKKTSLGWRLADDTVGRSHNGITAITPSQRETAGAPRGGTHRSRNESSRELTSPGGGSGDLALPGSPMASGSRLYNDESVLSQLTGGSREQSSSGVTAPQPRAGSRRSDPAEQSDDEGPEAQQPSSTSQRAAPEALRDSMASSEYEPTRRDARRQSNSRRRADAGEPSSGDTPAEAPVGNPRGAGKIAVPRRIDASCRVGRLVVSARETAITLPSAGSLHEVIDRLRDEIDRDVAAWGPPGEFFQWEPQLFLRVHAGALDTYYQLRFEMAGSGIAIEHEILIDDNLDNNFDFSDDSLLGAPRWFPENRTSGFSLTVP